MLKFSKYKLNYLLPKAAKPKLLKSCALKNKDKKIRPFLLWTSELYKTKNDNSGCWQ